MPCTANQAIALWLQSTLLAGRVSELGALERNVQNKTANAALERNSTSALLVHCTKKVNDHLIFPRPLGVCPSAFAIACSDIILTTSVRYAAICLFYRACSIATITGSPPLYRLFTITREKGVMATVHDHDGRRVRTMIFFQVLAPDAHRTRSNRRWNMFGARRWNRRTLTNPATETQGTGPGTSHQLCQHPVQVAVKPL